MEKRPQPIDYTTDTARGRILALLRAAKGRMVSNTALLEAMYGARADGGPMDAIGVLHIDICRLRKMGHPIGGGRGAGGYFWAGERDG